MLRRSAEMSIINTKLDFVSKRDVSYQDYVKMLDDLSSQLKYTNHCVSIHTTFLNGEALLKLMKCPILFDDINLNKNSITFNLETLLDKEFILFKSSKQYNMLLRSFDNKCGWNMAEWFTITKIFSQYGFIFL